MFPSDPHEPRTLTWLRNPDVRRTLILGTLWMFVLTVLWWFRSLLLPFGLAVLIAFIIEPVVSVVARVRIRGRPVPRIAGILAVYVSAGLLAYSAISLSLPQIGTEIAKLGNGFSAVVSNLHAQILGALDAIEAFATKYGIPIERRELDELVQQNLAQLTEGFRDNAGKLLKFGRDVVAGLFSGVFGLFLVLMLTAFLSMDRSVIERFARSMVPREYRTSYETIVEGIGVGLAGVVRGQILICLTNGLLTFIGLRLLGVNFPIILASLASIFSLVPIFGSITSTIPIVAIALTQSFVLAILSLLWIIGIHLVEANLLNPKIMGNAAKIHPLIVVFALVVGEKTSGLIGALFAVPIASVILTFFKFMHRRALDAVAESEAPSTEPREADPGSAA